FQVEQVRGRAFRQQCGQGTKTRGRVGLTWTVVETGTVDRERPKDGPKHRVMDTLAPTRLPAVGTGTLLLEIRVHLPLHHDFLQRLEHRFALREREAERLRCQIMPLHTRDVLDRFLAIVSDGHHLDLDLHGVSSADHTSDWRYVLTVCRSKWSGRNCSYAARQSTASRNSSRSPSAARTEVCGSAANRGLMASATTPMASSG